MRGRWSVTAAGEVDRGGVTEARWWLQGCLVSGGQKSTCFSNCINCDPPTTHPSPQVGPGMQGFHSNPQVPCSSITETRCC